MTYYLSVITYHFIGQYQLVCSAPGLDPTHLNFTYTDAHTLASQQEDHRRKMEAERAARDKADAVSREITELSMRLATLDQGVAMLKV